MNAIADSSFRVAVIGAGPAGLMAAETLAHSGARVTVYDRMPSVGRKLLMAGRGGLNLTHSEPFANFMPRYGAAMPNLRSAIESFSPQDLRAWCEALGQPTFVGSSGRVFPKSLKASPLLRAWLQQLADLNVEFALRHHWRGWSSSGDLMFDGPHGPIVVEGDAVVLALGGASWPRLGSDAAWVDTLRAREVAISSLRASNCGFRAMWSDLFRDRFAGAPIKGVGLTIGPHTSRGELIVTRDGLEGGGIYAVSSMLRDEIENTGAACLQISLRPDLPLSDLAAKLSAPRHKQSLSTFLRKVLALSPVAIALLHECAIACGRQLATMSSSELAAFINGVPVRLIETGPLPRAISTAGGVAFSEIDENFMIRRLAGVFVAGEMMDWEAPTGGYLLQASFATGVAAAKGALAWQASKV
jgi:uncharacterized flavoprotein (TIGR03862 family)